MLLIALHFEGGVDVGLGRGAEDDLERLVAWIRADTLRHRLVLAAIALHRRTGVTATDEQLAALAAALGRVPAETAAASSSADPLDAVAPAGSLQGKTLRAALALGDAGRQWVRWAAAQPWPLDPRFRAAVLEVARREGLALTDHPDDEAGTS